MAEAFPNGHFYSPVVDIEAVKNAEANVWKNNPEVLGIDFNDINQQKMLSEVFKYIF